MTNILKLEDFVMTDSLYFQTLKQQERKLGKQSMKPCFVNRGKGTQNEVRSKSLMYYCLSLLPRATQTPI